MFRAWMRHEHWVIWFTAAVVFILALLASRAERRVAKLRFQRDLPPTVEPARETTYRGNGLSIGGKPSTKRRAELLVSVSDGRHKKPRRSGAKVTTCIVGGLSVGPLRAFLS